MQSGCVICYDSFESSSNANSQQNGNDVGIVATLCGHVFHKSCLQEWLRLSHTCPECRSHVSRQYLTKLFINFCVENQSDNNALEALEEKLCGKDLECIEKEKKILGLQFDIALSERKIEDKVKKIKELEACFALSELQILEKDRQIEELQNCFAYSELQILEKDRKIEELQTSFTLSELGSIEKDQKIKELQTCVTRLEHESLKKDEEIKELKTFLSEEEMLQQQIKFDNKMYDLKQKVSKLNCAKAKNQLLQDKSALKCEKNILVGEVEHLNASQTIMEESSTVVKKILVYTLGHAVSEEKTASHSLATYRPVLKQKLTFLQKDKTQLQNELTQVKQELASAKEKETQLENVFDEVEPELAHSKDQRTEIQTVLKMMKRRMKRPHSNFTDKIALLALNLNDLNSTCMKACYDQNSVNIDVQSNLLPDPNLSKCNLVGNPSCSSSKNHVSSIVEDVKKAKKRKIDIIVLD